MKLVIVIALALVATVVAVDLPTGIIRTQSERNPDGSYTFGFQTEDGTNREEVGTVKRVPNEKNEPQDVVVVRGSYSYINKEGKPESVNYSADENGFIAEGDSIPKP